MTPWSLHSWLHCDPVLIKTVDAVPNQGVLLHVTLPPSSSYLTSIQDMGKTIFSTLKEEYQSAITTRLFKFVPLGSTWVSLGYFWFVWLFLETFVRCTIWCLFVFSIISILSSASHWRNYNALSPLLLICCGVMKHILDIQEFPTQLNKDLHTL